MNKQITIYELLGLIKVGIYDIVENIDCKLNEVIEFLNRKEDKNN